MGGSTEQQASQEPPAKKKETHYIRDGAIIGGTLGFLCSLGALDFGITTAGGAIGGAIGGKIAEATGLTGGKALTAQVVGAGAGVGFSALALGIVVAGGIIAAAACGFKNLLKGDSSEKDTRTWKEKIKEKIKDTYTKFSAPDAAHHTANHKQHQSGTGQNFRNQRSYQRVRPSSPDNDDERPHWTDRSSSSSTDSGRSGGS